MQQLDRGKHRSDLITRPVRSTQPPPFRSHPLRDAVSLDQTSTKTKRAIQTGLRDLEQIKPHPFAHSLPVLWRAPRTWEVGCKLAPVCYCFFWRGSISEPDVFMRAVWLWQPLPRCRTRWASPSRLLRQESTPSCFVSLAVLLMSGLDFLRGCPSAAAVFFFFYLRPMLSQPTPVVTASGFPV